MPLSAPPVDQAQDSALYQEVLHFYARQMRSLDEGEVADWAGTFTEIYEHYTESIDEKDA